MTVEFSWRKLLLDYYPGLDRVKGADLDHDGWLEQSGRTADTNGNQIVDDGKAGGFCVVNRYGLDLRPDNPVHSMFLNEQQTMGLFDSEIRVAYYKLGMMLDDLESWMALPSELYAIQYGEAQTALMSMSAIRLAIVGTGAEFVATDAAGQLIVDTVLNDKYDSRSASLVSMSLAHEMNWPVSTAERHHHTYLKWIGELVTVNFDVTSGVPLSIESSDAEPADDSGPQARELRMLGCAKMVDHKYEEAIQYLESAYRMDPFDRDTRDLLATTYIFAKRWSDAIDLLTLNIEVDPQHSEYYQLRGRALCEERNYVAAVRDFRRALELSPNDDDVRSRLQGYVEEIKYLLSVGRIGDIAGLAGSVDYLLGQLGDR